MSAAPDGLAFRQIGPSEWRLDPVGAMRVPGILYADAELVAGLDTNVAQQMANVATLPGIVGAAYAMPDAHWGYGFPIGGVAAFDPAQGGVVSAGGVGFDISCGVRTLLTGLPKAAITAVQDQLADRLFARVPAGMGKGGAIHLDADAMDAMLSGGARWAVEQGWGNADELARVEESGCMQGAVPSAISAKARQRQANEMGTLGSGNHYLEVQAVEEILDPAAAAGFGLNEGEVVISIHCGSRGLGHQIGTDYLREMLLAAPSFGIELPDRELACAPIESELGRRYLGAMRAAINCALANRQIIASLVREVFADLFPAAELELLFDVSHNTCKAEQHAVGGKPRLLYVHRKGATRALGPGHPGLPADLASIGQPVLIGGSMGTQSWILVGTAESEARAFSSACHGAGRQMSRHGALRQWQGRALVDQLRRQGISIRSPSMRGVAEEAPGAYKDVAAVVLAAEHAGLARRVARLSPLACIKG